MATLRQGTAIGLRCCLLAVPVLLQACAAKPPAPPASTTRLFAADMTGGAKQCSASKPELKPGQQASATMRVGNDGGWCAIHVALNGHPYTAGLLTTPAEHGKVFIHPVGDDTRIDYTPNPGYVGPDSFVAQLIPGDPSVRVAVTVIR